MYNVKIILSNTHTVIRLVSTFFHLPCNAKCLIYFNYVREKHALLTITFKRTYIILVLGQMYIKMYEI